MTGFVTGFCSLISDNKDDFCVFDWTVTERESSQLSCLVSAKCAAESQPSALGVLPLSPDHVSLLQFYCSVLALPLSLCLLSVSFRLPLLFGYAPVSGFAIGLCPINSDNNDSFWLFDWVDPECGSSEFSRAPSSNLAVLS